MGYCVFMARQIAVDILSAPDEPEWRFLFHVYMLNDYLDARENDVAGPRSLCR